MNHAPGTLLINTQTGSLLVKLVDGWLLIDSTSYYLVPDSDIDDYTENNAAWQGKTIRKAYCREPLGSGIGVTLRFWEE